MGLLTIVDVSCSLFLYRFIGNITEKSTAKSEVDKKKNRKRNLVSANIGITVLGISFFSLKHMCFENIYSLLRDDVLLYISWRLVNLGYI